MMWWAFIPVLSGKLTLKVDSVMSETHMKKTSEQNTKKDGKTVVIAFDGSEYAKNAMKCK